MDLLWGVRRFYINVLSKDGNEPCLYLINMNEERRKKGVDRDVLVDAFFWSVIWIVYRFIF